MEKCKSTMEMTMEKKNFILRENENMMHMGDFGWIIMEEMPSMGTWRCCCDPAGVCAMVFDIPMPPCTGMTGAAGMHACVIMAIKKGSCMVKMECYPPDASKPSKIMEMPIKVM